jgi:diguanylate cyclase (GGDEF)-like protein
MKPLLQAISRDLDTSIEQAELRGLARSAAEVEWLLLVLAGVYMVTPGSDLLRPGLALGASVLFAAFSLVMRFVPRFRRETRLKIGFEIFAMVAFTTVFLFSIEKHTTSLLILYLLPVIVCALTLGRWPTLFVTILSALAFLLAAALRDPTAALTGREIAELGIALAPFLLVAYLTALLAHEINTAKQRIRTLSETDELTGLANLRAFSRIHRQEHERAIRHGRSYSVVLMDLNGLKQVNDEFGHETGNRAIILFANVIARLIRTTDAAARYGGDEFVLMLSETDAEQANRVSHRIRSAVARCTIDVGGRMVKLSVSVGVATFPDDSEDPRDLIVKADEAMYRDKDSSRGPSAGGHAGSAELAEMAEIAGRTD